ncbi:indolepyruvate oxidoreductase subunit beta [candidate division WOR-3 bacterium]|nr:indolepyruvate oxidoreductase subunit beta [candidate division WOR-3 bacterium]
MNVLIAGVGGQGVILFSELLSNIALESGLDVKKSEVHGMAQRGGSVNTHVRFGPRVASPLIEEGTADLLVAFEKLEAVRYLHFLAPDGRLVYDDYRLEPVPVQLGLVPGADDADLDERIARRVGKRLMVPAFAAAFKLGNQRVQNVVMLGAVSGFLPFGEDACREMVRQMVKPEFVELNLVAFDRGLELATA